MKKVSSIILTVFLAISLCACNTKSMSLLYNETVQYDNFIIAINDFNDCCFVGHYTVEKYTDNMSITIPDAYNDMPIERIGGYYGTGVPTPFYIDLPEFLNAPEESSFSGIYGGHPDDFKLDVKYTIVELPFRLNIGKNINTIENVANDLYYPHINDDDSITFYHPVVEIVCDENNKHFYSKDGKLYEKGSDELVSKFDYKEE